jgi:hypothetical protein
MVIAKKSRTSESPRLPLMPWAPIIRYSGIFVRGSVYLAPLYPWA